MAPKINVILSIVAVAVLVATALAASWLIYMRGASASSSCINYLRQFDGAKQQWGLEHNKTTNDVPSWDDIRIYIKLTSSGELPKCPRGGTYTLGRIDESPRCTVMEHNMDFGSVEVYDESNRPLAEVRITVRSQASEMVTAITSTNGAAYLLSDPQVWQPVLWSNAWSDGTKRIVATKEGYSSNGVQLPTIYWPARLVLQKQP
jgi:hypothetical protein